MSRYEVTLRIRPLPWPVRVLRRIAAGPSHVMQGATSAPRVHIWFAVLVPYRWRRVHRWWAGKHRLFWLPCPMCGREFGGHEHDYLTGRPSSVPDPTSPPCYVLICPPCTRAGRGVLS